MSDVNVPESLEDVLADERGQAAVLKHNGHLHDAALINRICDRVAKAAGEYLTLIPEGDACLRTGKAISTLRNRFAEWEEQGLAKRIGKIRYYRLLILPPRANLSAAREEGRRAAGGTR